MELEPNYSTSDYEIVDYRTERKLFRKRITMLLASIKLNDRDKRFNEIFWKFA